MEEYDYIIIGSGFGGSVSAMRLSQKGYKVAVLESGKRWNGKDFPKTNWNTRKFLWLPKLFCYGIQRINILNHVMVLSGAGVGGGSLVYANTLYVPKKKFFETDTVKKLGGEKAFLPFYNIAKRMLGVVENPRLWEVDELMKETAQDIGKGDTFTPTPVGIYFGAGEDDKTTKDPYFGGEGPDRHACNYCGGCMVGCRFNAKNTLDKNYLYFAEKLGATIIPETKVTRVRPLNEDGSDGYEIDTVSTTGWFGSPRKTFRAKGVVFSAGVLGTVNLMLKLKAEGHLPRISDSLGDVVRTNSEAIIGVTARDPKIDFSNGIAITSSVHPSDDTHIEPVRYSKGSDVMGMLATVMTDGGGRLPRPLRFIGNVLSHPIDFLRTLIPWGFAKKSIILLVMQSIDNSIKLVRKRRWIWPFQKTLTSSMSAGETIPTYIAQANDFARRLAGKIDAIPQSSIPEVMLDIPTTAHVLGGAMIAVNPEEGVADETNHVYGYKNMLVCDGSMIPGNLGVNPSLSITAFTERAMSFIPPKEKKQNFLKFEQSWKITKTLTGAKPAAGQKVAKKKTAAKR